MCVLWKIMYVAMTGLQSIIFLSNYMKPYANLLYLTITT